jgi:hypothetical protein
MAKTYAQMKTNVGNFVQDTSSPFATLIGRWINDKYRDIARRGKWSALIDFDYTFNTVVGTATYDLPTDFEQELFVANTTDGQSLNRMTEGEWYEQNTYRYSGGSLTNGKSDTYIILEESSKIMLDPPPDAVRKIVMPYKKVITDMTGDSETVAIKDIEVLIEFGAISEAFAYKKQYQKADYHLQRYENELSKRIMQEKAKMNQQFQRIPSGYQTTHISRFTGEVPYA